MIGDYNVTQQIGTGSFAVVWKAHHKQRPGVVAIKEIATERLNKKLQESLKSEIDILQKANHPNIIKLHDIVEVGGICPSSIFTSLSVSLSPCPVIPWLDSWSWKQQQEFGLNFNGRERQRVLTGQLWIVMDFST